MNPIDLRQNSSRSPARVFWPSGRKLLISSDIWITLILTVGNRPGKPAEQRDGQQKPTAPRFQEISRTANSSSKNRNDDERVRLVETYSTLTRNTAASNASKAADPRALLPPPSPVRPRASTKMHTVNSRALRDVVLDRNAGRRRCRQWIGQIWRSSQNNIHDSVSKHAARSNKAIITQATRSDR